MGALANSMAGGFLPYDGISVKLASLPPDKSIIYKKKFRLIHINEIRFT